ncbi:MAG TPA: hypothetical protein VNX67_07885 [Solirubrobacteraceae bacterium]|nr:hypothetical protein [Solirubrobacteraceae bacterium]
MSPAIGAFALLETPLEALERQRWAHGWVSERPRLTATVDQRLERVALRGDSAGSRERAVWASGYRHHTNDDRPPLPEKAIEAALHEFDALRSLMAVRFQMLTGLLAAALTATGVIAGLALDHRGNQHLLLLIPPIASSVAIIDAEQRRRISLQGSYIRDRLWPYVQEHVNADLPAWEDYFKENGRVGFVVYGDNQVFGLLLLVSAAALAAGSGFEVSGGYVPLFGVGVLLTVAAVAFALLSAIDKLRD